MEVYPEFIRHLKKFVSFMDQSPSSTQRPHTYRRSTDHFEQQQPRRSTDVFEPSRKSTDHRRENPRRSTDRPDKFKTNSSSGSQSNNLEKLRTSFDQMERSRRSVDCIEKSRKSMDHQIERGRKSVDRVDWMRTG